MLLQEERELIVEYGKQMSAQGLSKGTSGNISIYDKESDLMVISPSGIGYFDTKPEDVVVMKLDGTIVESDRKPSSEWGFHKMWQRICRWQILSLWFKKEDYETVRGIFEKFANRLYRCVSGSFSRSGS